MKQTLALGFCMLLLLACGSLNKQLNKEQFKNNVESRKQESSLELLKSDEQRWFNSHAMQLKYGMAFIQSDSVIRYLPQGGFELSRGSVLFAEGSTREETSSERLIRANEENKLLETKGLEVKKESVKSVVLDKKRSIPWLVIGGGLVFTYICYLLVPKTKLFH